MQTVSANKCLESIVEIQNSKNFQIENVYKEIKKQINGYIIRLCLVKTSKDKLYFHVISLTDFSGVVEKPFCPIKRDKISQAKDIVTLIIPTGVGALYGGYAGDANPLAKLIAAYADNGYLLTHPNVINGSVLTDPPGNVIYLEGFFLEQFMLGQINIIPTKKNKIGVIFDSGISEKRLEYEVNVLNAFKSFCGVEIVGWTLTEKPLQIKPTVSEHGFSSGEIKNVDCLINAAFKLKDHGATAIAICSLIPDLELNKDYVYGKGVDPIGGIEAIISHIVSASCGLVSANAPVLINKEKVDFKDIVPVSAGEYIADTFLPAVISGLRFAPRVVKPGVLFADDEKNYFNISKLYMPYGSFGSMGAMFLNEMFNPENKVLLVKENITALEVNPDHLNVKFHLVEKYRDIVTDECFEKTGIDLEILNRPLKAISQII